MFAVQEEEAEQAVMQLEEEHAELKDANDDSEEARAADTAAEQVLANQVQAAQAELQSRQSGLAVRCVAVVTAARAPAQSCRLRRVRNQCHRACAREQLMVMSQE